MDAWQIGFLSLSEVQALLRRVFGCWADGHRSSEWLRAYGICADTFRLWEAQIEAELVAQGAMMDDADSDGALSAQPGAKRPREEGAARVAGGRHASTGDSLVDDICAVHLAAVDAMLQEAHAKGRGKEGDSP